MSRIHAAFHLVMCLSLVSLFEGCSQSKEFSESHPDPARENVLADSLPSSRSPEVGRRISKVITSPANRNLQFRLLEVSRTYACGITQDNLGLCWGEEGQEFWSTSEDLTNAQRLVLGPSYVCAITRNGKVVCWGAFGAVLPPADIEPITDLFLEMRTYSGCAMHAGAKATCWGRDSGVAKLEGVKFIQAGVVVFENGVREGLGSSPLHYYKLCENCGSSSRKVINLQEEVKAQGPLASFDWRFGTLCVVTAAGKGRCFFADENSASCHGGRSEKFFEVLGQNQSEIDRARSVKVLRRSVCFLGLDSRLSCYETACESTVETWPSNYGPIDDYVVGETGICARTGSKIQCWGLMETKSSYGWLFGKTINREMDGEFEGLGSFPARRFFENEIIRPGTDAMGDLSEPWAGVSRSGEPFWWDAPMLRFSNSGFEPPMYDSGYNRRRDYMAIFPMSRMVPFGNYWVPAAGAIWWLTNGEVGCGGVAFCPSPFSVTGGTKQ